MAKITPAAMKHAARLRAVAKKTPRAKRRNPDFDEELGDTGSDIMGVIGGLLGGGGGANPLGGILGNLFGGGGDRKTPAPAAGAAGPAPGVIGMPMPTNGFGATLEQIRAVVQDALAGNRDIVERMGLAAAGGDARLKQAADAVTGAIAPQLAQARGGISVQRLQTQATSEHRGLMNQQAREQLSAQRHADLVARLDRIAAAAANVQAQLRGGAGAAAVTNPAMRAILNVHG
jgi:hypothetical protein